MKFFRPTYFFLLLLTFLTVACDESNPNSFFSPGFLSSEVDLAVGDSGQNSVLLFFDIFADFDLSDPENQEEDVILGGLGTPNTIFLSRTSTGLNDRQGDLIAHDQDANELHVFRDYRNLSDNDAADTILLGTTSGFSDVKKIIIDDSDQLIATDLTEDKVFIFQNLSDISGDQAADIVLDQASSLVNNPFGVFSYEDDLYISNTGNGASDPCVSIFQNADNLSNAQVPSIRLNQDTSFINTGACTRDVYVNNDQLFTTTTTTDEIFVFDFFDNPLESDQLPSTILMNPNAQLDGPGSPVVPLNSNILFVVNNNQGAPTAGNPGLVGFFNPFNLGNNQEADIVTNNDLTQQVTTFHADLRTTAGALFSVSAPNETSTNHQVIIYQNAALINDQSTPDIVLEASPNANQTVLVDAHSIAVLGW